MGMGTIKRRRKSTRIRAFCEQLELRQLYNGVGMATADKDSQTLFGNVTMVNSAAYDAQLSSGASFTSTVGSLPAHTELNSIGFSVEVNLVGPGEDENNVVFTMTVDAQSVPVSVAWIQPGVASVSMNQSMLPHTSDTAGIMLTVGEPGSSDTFDVSDESVVADQDAWINAIQTDMYRDNDQPAVFDLVRGDDSGTPQAPGQAQDIYFTLGGGEYMAGLVNSDGTISPIDPNAAYADFGITVAGQNGGVTYDPNTQLFKTSIPANQSSVEMDFIPTNPPGVASVNPFIFQVDAQGTVTDPNTQIGFEFNAPQTNPATQPAVNGAMHGLNIQYSTSGLDEQALADLLEQLDDPNPSVREAAVDQLVSMANTNNTGTTYNQLMDAYMNGDPEQRKDIGTALNRAFPFGPTLQENNNAVTITLPKALLPDVGPNVQFVVFALDPSNCTVAFDVAGVPPSDAYTVAPGETTLPSLIVTPKHTGELTIKFDVQVLVSDGNGGWNVDESNPDITESMSWNVVDTSP